MARKVFLKTELLIFKRYFMITNSGASLAYFDDDVTKILLRTKKIRKLTLSQMELLILAQSLKSSKQKNVFS